MFERVRGPTSTPDAGGGSRTRDLNILIGNLGKIDNLRACLRSLYETTEKNISFKVFVGFNFSGDSDAPLALTREFPQVEILRAHAKLGYCRPMNQLLERARDARYVLFLDDDTLLRPGTIEAMVRFMDEHAEVGVAGCRTVNPDGSYQKSTALMYNAKVELLNAIRPAAFWSDGIDETVHEWRSVGWLTEHLAAFLAAYNFAKRLKTLRGLTPHEYVCKIWKAEPDRFKNDPTQLTSGLYT